MIDGRQFRKRDIASNIRGLFSTQTADELIRSLSPTAWWDAAKNVTVTGLGASTWADQSGNGRDLLQGTDASRPPYLSYSGTKYLYLPGVASNNATTPDSAAHRPTGDVELIVKCRMADWTPATIQAIYINGTQASVAGINAYLYLNVNGTLEFSRSNGGSLRNYTSTAATGVSDGSDKWIKVTWDQNDGAGNSAAIFYLSDDGSSWTKLGNTVNIADTAAGNSNTTGTRIGEAVSGSTLPMSGRVYRAIYKSGIDGTTVVDFNPNLDASDASTSFASSATGETWTVNSSGGLPAQIVGRPSLLFDGTADYLKCNAFTLNQPETVYLVFKQVSWTNSDGIFDGNTTSTGLLYQNGVTPHIYGFPGTTNTDPITGLAVGTYGVVAAVFNGASSFLQHNFTQTTVASGSGTANMGGFTLGAWGDNTKFGNVQVLEVLIFSTAHDATKRALVINALMAKHRVS